MTGDPSGDERRRYRRFRLRVPVTVLGSTDQPASRDLSEGGMFIETSVPRRVGIVLPLRLVHPETGEIIPAVCQVVRQVRGDDGELLGLGLRFANTDERLGERVRNLIRDLVADREQPRPAPDATGGELDDGAGEALAVVEFHEPEVTWEITGSGDEAVEVVVVEAEVADDNERDGPIPIVWPDTKPERIPGAVRHGLTPMQLRLLPFIDGSNTVEEVATGAGLNLEAALGDLSDMARRAVVRIPTPSAAEVNAEEDSVDGTSDSAQPLFPGRNEHADEQERWRKARSLVTQGLAAERNDEFGDAVTYLERALELRPPNAANIHARLAIVGMEQLGDLDLAEVHARAAQDADPLRPHGRRLIRRVKRLRAKGVTVKARERKPRPDRPAPKERTAGPRSAKRAAAASVLALLLLGLIGWNLYRHLWPMLDAPPHLDVRRLSAMIPTLEARLRDGRLVVTTSSAWDSMTDMEKTGRLERLADWARAEHGVTEIVVADDTPVLCARVRGGEVTLYSRE